MNMIRYMTPDAEWGAHDLIGAHHPAWVFEKIAARVHLDGVTFGNLQHVDPVADRFRCFASPCSVSTPLTQRSFSLGACAIVCGVTVTHICSSR